MAVCTSKKSKLLLVDDNILYLKTLRDVLGETYTYELQTATDGKTALELLESTTVPDLILLDVKMPGMDGYEVCRRLKMDERTRDIPVIFLTSIGTDDDQTKGLELGAVDFIIKPSEFSLIKRRIQTHLELKQHRDQLQFLVDKKIHELDSAKESEQKREALLQSILMSVPVAVGFIVDRKIVWSNQQTSKISGYTCAELEGQPTRILYPSDEVSEKAGRKYPEIKETGFSSFDTVWRTKNGIDIDVHVNAIALDKENLAAGVIFSVLDITERKQAEGERERLLQAIDQSGETIVITDSEGTIQYVNPAFEKITGYTCDEAIGQNPRILKSNKHDETFYQQMWGKLVGGDIWRGQLTNKKKDGTLYIEEAVISPVSDTSGSIVNFVAVKRDITESNQLQEEILKRARLASLGELSAGVAHEINNPNALILYNSDILTAVFKDLLPWLKENQLQTAGQLFGGLSYRDAIEEIPLLLPAIHDAAQRIKRIVDDLRDFSRQDSSAADEAVDVNLVIQSAIRLANNTIKKATDCFELHLTAALPAVSGVKGRLEQVVINLLLNACQALESRSQKITVTTQYAADTDQLQVLVADEGEGVPAEVAAHILEPFVTTKREQGGTGLGLSVSARIVKEHHGELKFTSSPGKGTIFTLSLPTRKEINHGS